MYATLLSALVLAQVPPPGQPQPPPVRPAPPLGQPGQPSKPAQPLPVDRAPAAAVSLDGNWTVLFCSKEGQDQADLKDKTVTIRNNVATVTGADADKMKAMRLELGANGQIRVTEINGAERPGAPGAERPGAPGAVPARPADPSAAAAPAAKTGVIVQGGDYMSLALFSAKARIERRPGATPGGTPGATPLGAQPAPPGARPAADEATQKPDFIIVLKRAGNTTPGAPGGIEPRR